MDVDAAIRELLQVAGELCVEGGRKIAVVASECPLVEDQKFASAEADSRAGSGP
ncbi:hypothetical protein ACU4GR_13475 [Methylobacterium oryzae CBMB20]